MTGERRLADRELLTKIQALGKIDNFTNFIYLLRAYLILFVVIGATVWFYQSRASYGLSSWWLLPVTVFSIIVVGSCQHQLAGLVHEANHKLLFKNRYLNELVSDWLCFFPIFNVTYFFRLQHLGHHQFTNDPERDPDVHLLKETGFWLESPRSQAELRRMLLVLLNPIKILRYMMVRWRFSASLSDKNPYWRPGAKSPTLINRCFDAYYVLLMSLSLVLAVYAKPGLILIVPVILWALMMGVYLVLPASYFEQSRFQPVFPLRVLLMMRATYMLLFVGAMLWIHVNTTVPAYYYLLLLWGVPVFTSFSFFTILQQMAQHCNADRGRFTNSRVMVLSNLANFCIFPVSLGYHQPHHLFPTVPHYRVRKMHKLLMDYPEYRDTVVVAEGYFLPPALTTKRPTVVDTLGPAYAPTAQKDIFIDHSVLKNHYLEAEEQPS